MDGILIKMNLKEKNIKLHNLVLEKKWTTLLATIVIRLEDFILCDEGEERKRGRRNYLIQ
jgi:hypothetical protein